MWPFKNLQLYRLPSPWAIDKDSLTEKLKGGQFSRCKSNQPMSRGWVPALEHGDLVHSVAGHWLLCLKVEKRLLPASVVNEEVAERAATIEEQQGYAPGRKQLKDLRERVTEELLPRAFTRSRRTFVWMDPANSWFGINASSAAKAEEVIEHLRHCLDEFPLRPLRTKVSPQLAISAWLLDGEGPAGFTIDRDCELKSAGEEKATVRYVRHPLGDEVGDEIKAHLAVGKLPTRLALTWDDRISFVLNEKMEIKRIVFLDLIKEGGEQSAETADEQFDADFVMMTGEFGRFLPMLLEALGGEEAC